MNIFKRRNSIQKTSQKWKTLWLEYIQQLQELHDDEFLNLKLKILSNFMEKILILDLQLSKLSSTSSTSSSSSSSTTSTSNDIFDDHPSIILTGLLDVVQRSTIELKSFIDNENDRLVLNEILRKSLLIIEILVKEKKNRQKITDAPDIICRIICILSNLECFDDKIITLTILSYLIRHDKCRQEFSHQEGYKLLTSLYMNETVVYATQSAPFSESSKEGSPQSLNTKILRILQLSLLYEKKGVQEIDQDPTSPSIPVNPATRTQSHPSLIWGLSMAFSVMNELISAAPLSVNWLKRIKGDLHENEPGAINQDASTVDSFGGISLVIPESFTQNDGVKVNLIEWERVRLEKLRESVPPNPSIDPHLQHLDSDDIGLNVDDEKSLPDVITSMKSQGVTSIFIDQMRTKISLFEQYSNESFKSETESDIICILCTIKTFLIQNYSSQTQFHLEGGYDILSTLLIQILIIKEKPYHSCLECIEINPTLSNLENDSGNPIFHSEYHANIIFFLLSLLFDTNIQPSHFLTCIDSSISLAYENIFHIKNLIILEIILKFLENDQPAAIISFGLSLVEIILRLNPLTIIAIQDFGGILSLEKNLIKLIFNQFICQPVPVVMPEIKPQLYQRSNRSRSSSSGTSSSSTMPSTEPIPPLPPSEKEIKEEQILMKSSLTLTVEIMHLLVRINVICSERNLPISTFFLILTFFITSRLSPVFINTIPLEKCSNCEAETAEYECTHQSCSSEGLNRLCRECDRVFHKAATKRSHLRIPVVSHVMILNKLLSTLDSELQQVLQSMNQQHSSMIRSPCGIEYLYNTLCLLLYHFRTLMDDKRRRNKSLDEDALSLLVIVLRLTLTISSSTNGSNHTSTIEISSTSILNEITSKITSAILGRKTKIDSSNSENGSLDEPPEDNHGICHRIILSLLVQNIGRYFTPPIHLEDSLSSSSLLIATEQRSIVLDRIRTIRQLGLEACLILLAIENTSQLPLTLSDRQYSLIIFREIIIEAYRSDIGHGVSLLRWFVWLLCSPVYTPNTTQHTTPIIESRIKNFSVLINSRLVRELIRDHEHRGSIFAVIPTETCPIPLQLRIFILQEIRILIGGDDWIPIISDPHLSKVDTRIYYLLEDHSMNDNHENNENHDDDRELSILVRVPVSKHILQNHLIKAGIMEILSNIIHGDLSTSGILKNLNNFENTGTCTSTSTSSGDTSVHLTDIEIIDWWSSIATLNLLITCNNYAKEEFDAVLGVTEFTKILLPFIEHTNNHHHPISKKSGTLKFQLGLVNFLFELCITGQRWISPSRPFTHWSKICLLNHTSGSTTSSTTSHPPTTTSSSVSNCLLCRYLKLHGEDCNTTLLSHNYNHELPAISNDICPVYYTKSLVVDQHRECYFPQVIFRRINSTSRHILDSKQFHGSQHISSRFSVEHDCDDSSTGRGSFSLTSLHGFPRACSFSNFTPPPSLAGDIGPSSKFSFDDGLGSRAPRNGRTDSRADEVVLPSYSGQYIPLLSGLNWGLQGYDTLILGVLYEGLLNRSGNSFLSEELTPSSSDNPAGKSSITDNHRGQSSGSDPLLTSLRRQSVEQHMQSFLSTSTSIHNSSPSTAVTSPPRWEPQYSRILVRNSECVDVLFALSLLFQDDLQLFLLNSISRLIEGNPMNAEIISQRNIPLSLSKLSFKTDEISRNRLSHILSRLFKQRISAYELSDLISSARRIGHYDMKDLLFHPHQKTSTSTSTSTSNTKIPIKGIKTLITDSNEGGGNSGGGGSGGGSSGVGDDYGCQILFMLGMSIENLGPTVYTHFDHNCPFSSHILLPSIEKLPSHNIGFSIICWIHVGSLGIVPISILMQLYVGKDGKIHKNIDSSTIEVIQVIDIFFRTIYKQNLSKDCDTNSLHSHSNQYYDPPLTGTSTSHEDTSTQRKKYLQLCISYRSYKDTQRSSSSTSHHHHHDDTSTSDNLLMGLDPQLISSLAHFSTPDVIIDYDWIEMTEWHLLSLSFSNLGIRCIIDGKYKRSLYWTALGYSEILDSTIEILPGSTKPSSSSSSSSSTTATTGSTSASKDTKTPTTATTSTSKDTKTATTTMKPRQQLGTKYLTLGKDQHLLISLGGLYYEQELYHRSIEHLNDLIEQCKLSTIEKIIEERITTEVDFLQCYKELINGFSGYISTMVIIEGIPDINSIQSLYTLGYGTSMITLTSHKKILAYNSLDSNIHRVLDGTNTSNSNLHFNKSLIDNNNNIRGRDFGTRNHHHQQQQHHFLQEEFPFSGRNNNNNTNSHNNNNTGRRISRSLSPVSAKRTLERDLTILSYDDNIRGNTSTHTNTTTSNTSRSSTHLGECDSGIQNQIPSSSLVSDLLTMFSSGPSTKEDDHHHHHHSSSHHQNHTSSSTGSTSLTTRSNVLPVIYGTTRIFTAKIFANEMNLLGGLRFLYPFLIMDKSRQIAVLRIISTLYLSFKSIQEEFYTFNMDKVILYCLYMTPYVTTQGSIQIFFDLATSNSSYWYDPTSTGTGTSTSTNSMTNIHNTSSILLISKNIDKIYRIEFLKLAIDISLASPKRIQLARCTVEWLLEICEDSYENINKVLEHIGLLPFLIILSIWVCDEIQEFETITTTSTPTGSTGTSASSATTSNQEVIRISYVKMSFPLIDERILNGELYPQQSVERILSSDSLNFKYSSLPYKTQVAIAKFLRLLITGSIGQLPPIIIPISQHTPTGFSSNHMSILLSFIQYIISHEDIFIKSKNEMDHVNVTTPIHHPNSPHTWRLYSAQLALDLLLEVCEGPLFGTIMNMIRNALPGPAIWNFLFDLLRCPHVAIRVRAIHLLGLSLCGNNGDIDSRLVLQFEKIQGFAALASRLSDCGGNTEPITESLLSLFFWRRAIRSSSCESSLSSSQNPLFGRLDVIEEVESVTGTSEPHRSRQNTIDGERQQSLTDAALLALSEIDVENELNESIEQGNLEVNPQGNTSNENATNLQSQNQGGGFMSIFSWMSKSEGVVEGGRLSTEDSRTGPQPDTTSDLKSSDDKKFGSKMGKLKIKAEVIVLPQILQSILTVLQNENSSERVSYTIGAIESSLTPLTVCNGSGVDTVDQESLERCTRNAEILSSQKDWLLWICECMLCYQRRFSQGNLIDGSGTILSTSDAESASGMESGDDSCDGSYHATGTSTSNSTRRMSGTATAGGGGGAGAGGGGGGYISPSYNINILERFYDPLLRIIQSIFAFDIIQKPTPSLRKIYDIFRLPVPEARDIQLLILFNLIELFEKQQLKNTSTTTATTSSTSSGNNTTSNSDKILNLMRNMSTLLDQVLEKCEINLEFCVKSIQIMNSLIYHVPQDIRLKIKDTLLFDVKLAYVMRCLVDRQEDIWERISWLSLIQSSIIDLISSGIPNRTIQDNYLSILFLDIFLQASCDIINIIDMNTSTNSNSTTSASPSPLPLPRNGSGTGTSTSATTSAVITIPIEYINLQLASLILIQNCIQISQECKRSIEKILQNDFHDDQREILTDGFCGNFGKRSLTPTSSNIDQEDQPTITLSSSPSASSQLLMQKSTSWWGSWGSNTETSSSTSVSLAIETPTTTPAPITTTTTPISNNLDLESGNISTLLPTEGKEINQRPDDSMTFLTWFNQYENRDIIEILTKKVAKILPSLYQKTDKIQEKIAQRRSRHVRQVQDRHSKEKSTLNKSIHEVLSKSSSVSDKFGRKYAHDANRVILELKEKIMKGSHEFYKCGEVPRPFEKDLSSSTLLTPPDTSTTTTLGSPPQDIPCSVNMLFDQIMNDLHSHMY